MIVLLACGTPPSPESEIVPTLPAAAAHRTVDGPTFFAIWVPDDEPLELLVTGPRGAAPGLTRTQHEIFETNGRMDWERGLVVPGQGVGSYRIDLRYTDHHLTDSVTVDVTEATELVEVHALVHSGLTVFVVESSSTVVLTPHESDGRVRFGLRNVGDRPLGPWFRGDVVQLTPTAAGVSVGHSGCGNVVFDAEPPPVAVGAEVDIPLAAGGGYDTLLPGDYLWTVELGDEGTRALAEAERAHVFLRRAGLVRFTVRTPMTRPFD